MSDELKEITELELMTTATPGVAFRLPIEKYWGVYSLATPLLSRNLLVLNGRVYPPERTEFGGFCNARIRRDGCYVVEQWAPKSGQYSVEEISQEESDRLNATATREREQERAAVAAAIAA